MELSRQHARCVVATLQWRHTWPGSFFYSGQEILRHLTSAILRRGRQACLVKLGCLVHVCRPCAAREGGTVGPLTVKMTGRLDIIEQPFDNRTGVSTQPIEIVGNVRDGGIFDDRRRGKPAGAEPIEPMEAKVPRRRSLDRPGSRRRVRACSCLRRRGSRSWVALGEKGFGGV